MAMDASTLAAAMKTQLEGALGEERVALSPEIERGRTHHDHDGGPSADVVIAGAVE